MKKIWILLLLLSSGNIYNADIFQEEQKVAQEEVSIWAQEMIGRYGNSFKGLIGDFNQQTESYTTAADECEAEDFYQNLLKEYNPQALNQVHRGLYNDLYKRLEDIKIWRSFLKDLELFASARSAEKTHSIYQCLRKKYQTGSSGKSRGQRQQLLRNERDARLAILIQSPQQAALVPPPSPIFSPQQHAIAPTAPPSPVLGRLGAPEDLELGSPWEEES